jgi:hypothetical protein
MKHSLKVLNTKLKANAHDGDNTLRKMSRRRKPMGRNWRSFRKTERDGQAWFLDDPHKVKTWKKDAVCRIIKSSMRETLSAPRHYQHLQMFNLNTR